MSKRAGGRPSTNIAERFRASLWALRIKQALGLSWADIDNKYVIDEGVWQEPYDRARYKVIRRMERIFIDGRTPESSLNVRKERINLVEAFPDWESATTYGQYEYYHPLWNMLTNPRRPARNNLDMLCREGYGLRGLVKLQDMELTFGRQICGATFPSQEGDVDAIRNGAALIASKPSLDALLLLAIEYRTALDRLRPIEAQCYLDAFVDASEGFTEAINDEYIGNGIAILIVLRLFRNDWTEIGPEKWRRSALKKPGPFDPTSIMATGDKIWDLVNYGPSQMAPVRSLLVAGTPVFAPDEKIIWFLNNLNDIILARHKEAMPEEFDPIEIKYPENWKELLEIARNLWGKHVPVEATHDFGFQGRSSMATENR